MGSVCITLFNQLPFYSSFIKCWQLDYEVFWMAADDRKPVHIHLITHPSLAIYQCSTNHLMIIGKFVIRLWNSFSHLSIEVHKLWILGYQRKRHGREKYNEMIEVDWWHCSCRRLRYFKNLLKGNLVFSFTSEYKLVIQLINPLSIMPSKICFYSNMPNLKGQRLHCVPQWGKNTTFCCIPINWNK